MGKATPHCSVIIVTHNSQKYIDHCIDALTNQSEKFEHIVIVDSGSADPDYLSKYDSNPTIHLDFQKENVGFCEGNNLGMAYISSNTDYVLFLNPDAFLTPDFLKRALEFMEEPSSFDVGAISGILLGYDINLDKPTEKIDSLGIDQKWYGNWFDRAQGQDYDEKMHQGNESVKALCGALMFCRMDALKSVLLAPNTVMDPSFYMYKEDIDLSLRLRKKGWRLIVLKDLVAYHCRGWKERSKVPKYLRLMAAKNEIRLHARNYSPCILYSILKYLGVKLFNL